jgi:penicillin-binding protein 1A
VALLRLWRPVQTDPAGRDPALWRRTLRVAISVIVLPALSMAIIFTLVKVIAQSEQWDLPSGRLLDTILSSCQFEHSSRAGVDVEHMICPTRLGASEFPQVLKDAVIASEDERFLSHGAIDHPATLRAAWHFSLGDRQGGSTITQQLARSILLKKEDSLERKLMEAVLAIRIYVRLSRNEILTRYMNVVPHARNMNGFDDPARYYFGVGAEDVNLAEAALLVGMLPEPNNRDPLKNPPAALRSAVSVLQRMLAERKITRPQAVRAEDELKRRIENGRLRRGSKVYSRLEYRPYRDLALREAAANGIKLPEDYRLIVFIDPEFQQTLQTQICSITGMYQGAGFFMRPSGEALALTGSCAYTGEWNRATDIARSIGSTGKLFPLIGVHEAGLSLNERFSTWPLRRSSWPAEPNPLCRQRAKVSLEFALAQSCNRPWTEASMLLGPRVTDIVKRFGITPPNAPSLVPIGGVQTSPMKLAQAYAALENGGMLPQVRFLTAAIGPRGNIVGVPPAKDGPRVMSTATASSVLQALRGPVKRGTARAANSPHALVYGKTGTSSRNEDALFVGLTEAFVGGLWLGYDWPAPMPGIHGGGTPAKAFSKLTDFYYVRLAQARFAESEKLASGASPWGKLKIFAARQPGVIAITALGSLVTLCFVLPALFRRRGRPVKPAPIEPTHEDRDLQHQQYQQAPFQSS